jgi:hypothetical protein
VVSQQARVGGAIRESALVTPHGFDVDTLIAEGLVTVTQFFLVHLTLAFLEASSAASGLAVCHRRRRGMRPSRDGLLDGRNNVAEVVPALSLDALNGHAFSSSRIGRSGGWSAAFR